MTSEGKNVVRILDSIFRIFDALCAENGAQKIEVIFFNLKIKKLKINKINKKKNRL